MEAIAQSRGTTSSRYTILGRLASGGMADIYLVRSVTDGGVDRHLVLKRVLSARSTDPLFAQMFADEARLSAHLQHPNIAQVYDVGTLDGASFYTMEYVHGENVHKILRHLSKQKKKLPENLCLYIASSALAALHHAHERKSADGEPLNIIHRDVTPANIMVSQEGVVKLLDFGVAKASQRKTKSREGAIKGKVGYLSPEQCHGTTIDRRSDIFALGIVLYELLTCKRLYDRDTEFNTMLALTNEPPAPPSERRPGLSPDIDQIVLKALEKDPAKRYATATAMLEDIEAVAAAERYILTGNAMARFMSETFGSKPEPWVDLQAVWDTKTGVTAAPGVAAQESQTQVIDVEDLVALETQLAQAPDLPQLEAARKSQPLDAQSSPGSSPSVSSASDKPILVLPAAKRRRAAIVVIATIGALAVAAGGYYVATSRDADSGRATPPTSAVTQVQVPLPPPVATPAATPQSSGAAPAPTSGEPAPTIETAARRGDWPAVSQLCAAADPQTLTASDRKECGIAACKRKQRAIAMDHYENANQADKPAIENVCKESGISIAPKTPRPTTRPRRDPCKDKAYVRANPLRCQ